MLLARLPLRYIRTRVSTVAIQKWRYQSTSAATIAVPKSTITLRPYQEESIQAVLSYVEQGHKRLGLSLATGSGKTVVFTQLIDRVTPPRPYATQTLILAHRRELVDQAYRHCRLAYPEKSIEIELGKVQASGAADITVASMQSITSQDRIEKFDPKRFKLVLVDEAHHIVAPKYLEILDYFGIRYGADEDAPVLVGVSATMSRFDGLMLGAAIDHIVYHKDYIEMINEKWLSDVVFTTVLIKADLAKIKSGVGGDFQIGSLSKAVNTPENNEATFLAWQQRGAGRKSTLVFCVDVRHIHDLTATFRRHGTEANFVTGETPSRTRSELLDDFKRGIYPVLLNCGVFTEGTDIPNVDCVVLARPTKSRNLLVQMIGRGTRLHPGKSDCHIIDMVSSLKTGIVTTPTLFGLDPDELIKDATMDDMQALREKKETELLAQSSLATDKASSSFSGTMTYTDYDSVEDLLGDQSGEQNIRFLSQFAWVQVDDHRYILSTNVGNYLTLKTPQEDGVFEVDFTAKLPPSLAKKSPYARPRRVGTASTFEDAVHAADSFALTAFVNTFFLTKSASWRKGPASAAQLKMLNKGRDKDKLLESTDVTKGQANDMITKIKFGAKGRFNKLVGSRNKAIREQESLTQKLQKLGVHKGGVGPVVLPAQGNKGRESAVWAEKQEGLTDRLKRMRNERTHDDRRKEVF